MHIRTTSPWFVAAGACMLAGLVACGGDEFTASQGGASSSGDDLGGKQLSDAAAGDSAQTSAGGAQQGGAGGSTSGAGGSASASGGGSTGGSGASAGSAPVAGAGGASGASAGAGGENVGGSAGASGCGFDTCHISQVTTDPTCNACTQLICLTRPYCCTTGWDLGCVLEARMTATCGCKQLECSTGGADSTLADSCGAGGTCNAVNDTGCGTAAHCMLYPTGDQLVPTCLTAGSSAPCMHCDNQYNSCGPGHSCVGGKCLRLCCDASECPSPAVCSHDVLSQASTIGVCTSP
jgi:hypothetical protein